MQFIVYDDPPLEFMDYFHQVNIEDPIRKVFACFSSFDEALEKMEEYDFENYGVFVRLRNPKNDVIYRQTNFFFQKTGFSNHHLIPIPPFHVYKRTIKQDTNSFVVYQQGWITNTIVSKILSNLDENITFIAEDYTRKIAINKFLKDELLVKIEPVPLLVLKTPEQSLQFAEFVIGLLHQTHQMTANKYIQKNQHIIQQLSVDRRRKLYDIFPEEYISIPDHIWRTLKQFDDVQLLEHDIEELCLKYNSFSLT